MSSFIKWVAARAPHCARLAFPSALARGSRLLSSALIVCAISAAADNARAIEISIASVTLIPDSTTSGAYTGSGQGTSAWDSTVATTVASGSAPTTVGATANAAIRTSFNISTVAPADSSSSFTATLHYQVLLQVTNDDPSHNPTYLVSMSGNLAGVAADGGAVSTTSTDAWQEAIFNGHNTSTSHGGGTGPSGDFGPFTNSFQSGIGAGSGTTFYTVDFTDTLTVSAQASGAIAVLAGLDSGLNPALGALQHYPSGAGHTDASLDGESITFSAKVLSAPEPSSAIIVVSGAAMLGLTGMRRRRLTGTQ
jgi:hypothetical protein